MAGPFTRLGLLVDGSPQTANGPWVVVVYHDYDGKAFVPRPSTEERVKVSYGFPDKLRNSIQHWEQQFALENPLLIDRYKKGKLHILLKFSSGIVPEEYVIVFEAKPHVANKKIPTAAPL
ncbi:MAG TPA: hypothetical protein VN736_01685, partial [Candidatus Limnocylindrales bacterium]|nr:hypothetical protein [Candidatus Limnocylindrales bacterium]